MAGPRPPCIHFSDPGPPRPRPAPAPVLRLPLRTQILGLRASGAPAWRRHGDTRERITPDDAAEGRGQTSQPRTAERLLEKAPPGLFGGILLGTILDDWRTPVFTRSAQTPLKDGFIPPGPIAAPWKPGCPHQPQTGLHRVETWRYSPPRSEVRWGRHRTQT